VHTEWMRTPSARPLASSSHASEPCPSEDLGLPTYGERRRSVGCGARIAMLAGVSSSYYTAWSKAVPQRDHLKCSTLSLALQLDDAERQHLRTLGAPSTSVRPRSARRLSGWRRRDELLIALVDVPAVVLGRRSELLLNDLACSSCGHITFRTRAR